MRLIKYFFLFLIIGFTSISSNAQPLLSGGFVQVKIQFDPSAQAIIDQMTTNGSTPSEARQILINQLVLDLKGLGNTGSADIWSKLDLLQIYAAEDRIQALTEWVNADGSLDATEFNSPSFTANSGYIVTQTASIISNYIPSVNGVNYTQNSASFGMRATSLNARYWVGIDENPLRSWIRVDTDGSIDLSINGNISSDISHSSFSDAFLTLNRPNSTSFEAYTNGVLNGTATENSIGLNSTYPFLIGGINRSTPLRNVINNVKLFFTASYLNASETLQLHNSLDNYINSL